MRIFLQTCTVALLALISAAPRLDASALTLNPGTAAPGSVISLPLTFSGNGDPVSGLEWTLTFSSADFSAFDLTPGPAPVQAGKSLSCTAVVNGRSTCLLTGMSASQLVDGIIATAQFTVAATPSSTSSQIGLSAATAASPAGDAVIVSPAGAIVTIPATQQLSGLSCAPSTVNVGASATCTVSLLAPAATALSISLGSSSAQPVGISLPASVSIPTGSSAAAFTALITSASVSSTVTVSATWNSTSRTSPISVTVPVTASVAPAAVSLAAAQTRQFAASVSGAANQSVVWSVAPAIGSVSQNGLYSAPALVATNQTVTVRATSVANSSAYATAIVNLTATVPVADTVPPVITWGSAVPAQTSANLSWTTNEPSLSRVVYGASAAALTATANHSVLTTSPRITLSGLAGNTTYYYRVYSSDAALNSSAWPLAASAPMSFKTTAAPVPPSSNLMTLWTASVTPSTLNENDSNAVELGMKFSADVTGVVTGVRFYKGSTANQGPHKGSLWTSTGTRLASAVSVTETASGWQNIIFSNPVRITLNTTYVVSYHAPAGHYSVTENGLKSAVHTGPLHAPALAGVYLYGSGGFPREIYNASNYWVDVLFAPDRFLAAPAGTSILTGAPKAGRVEDLSSDDGRYLQVNSTALAPYKAAWTATLPGVSTAASELTVHYGGRNSRSGSESVSIWNVQTSAWAPLDTRTVGTTESLRILPVPAPAANYVAANGDVRVKVESTATAAFYSIGDLLRVEYK